MVQGLLRALGIVDDSRHHAAATSVRSECLGHPWKAWVGQSWQALKAKLTNFEIESLLTQLPGWTVVAGKLHREYRFPNFGKAFGFMKTAAPAIEKMDHHPEWFNAYDRVVIDLTTHDLGGISQKDVDLAKRLEEIASKLV